jgi:hypothetical protein
MSELSRVNIAAKSADLNPIYKDLRRVQNVTPRVEMAVAIEWAADNRQRGEGVTSPDA